MKFCFAITDTVLPADFIGVGFSEVNPCFLHHHTGVGPQKVWTYNSPRLQLFTAWLLHVCKIQRRGPWVRDLLGFSVCVEILVFLGRQAAPAHLPCCANSRSQCHRLVSRECTHTRACIHGVVALVFPLGARMRLGSSLSLPKNSRTTQDRLFSSLLKSCWSDRCDSYSWLISKYRESFASLLNREEQCEDVAKDQTR